jgi:hypothetical protein
MTKSKAKKKVTPQKPIVADVVTVAPTQLGFFERIWKWLKDRVK